MSSNRLTILALMALAGCGGESAGGDAAKDLSRDLQRVPVDSSATLADRSTSSGASVATEAAPLPAPKPQPKPKATPKPKPKPAPAPTPVVHALASGATLSATADREISSKTDKAGQTFTATVANDVADASGTVVIPAGSKVTLTIAEIHRVGEQGRQDREAVVDADLGRNRRARATALDASSVGRWTACFRDRKTNAGDVAKVGAGTAAGAIVGRVIGGEHQGRGDRGHHRRWRLGTQRAVETQDRDVVVPAGSRVELTLNGAFTRE